MKGWLIGLSLLFLTVSCSLPATVGEELPGEDGGGDSQAPDSAGGELVAGVCGDGLCQDNENCEICPADCGPCSCGDGICTSDESHATCPEDCETVGAFCGDGECSGEEDCRGCPADCGLCCGDGECNKGESCASCPGDCGECPTDCGNGECGDGEDCENCPGDCGECPTDCGNGECGDGEDCENCAADCGECPTDCGNGECGDGEDCENCAADCGECPPGCGDGECGDGEGCKDCPADCGPCPPGCGDKIVQVDLGEQCDDGNLTPDDGCDEECQIEPQEAEPGEIIITEIMKNPEAVDDPVGEWFELHNTTDQQIDINGWLLKDDGIDEHQILAPGGLPIPAGGSVVLGRSLDPLVNGGIAVDYAVENFNLANKDDEILLMVYGVVIDSVKYDNGVAFPNKPGHSVSLSADKYDHLANDLGGSWCSSQEALDSQDFGSPGGVNPLCPTGPLCPDGSCGPGEDQCTCPADCGSPCAGKSCGEDGCGGSCGSCSATQYCDGGSCKPLCGNGLCAGGETTCTCPADCGSPCAGKVCGEDGCGGSCGSCSATQYCDGGSCKPLCGNGLCAGGETKCTCPADCGSPCAGKVCGDNGCGGSCGSCAGGQECVGGQCQSLCGNGQCNVGENCSSCPLDCGGCPESGWCELSGKKGSEVVCELHLAAFDQLSPKATGMEFVIEFSPGSVAFSGFSCQSGAFDPCDMGFLPTGHNLASQEQSAGKVKTLIYGSGAPKAISPAWLEGATIQGNSKVVELLFVLAVDIPANQAAAVTLASPKATDATASPLNIQAFDGVLVTWEVGGGPVCGNSKCDNGGGEDCSNCPADCGACPQAGWCSLVGEQGATVSCPVKLAAASSLAPKATAIELVMEFDGLSLTWKGFSCNTGAFDPCQMGFLPTGHNVVGQVQTAGKVKSLVYGSGAPKAISAAVLSGETVVGEPEVFEVLFTLGKAASPTSPQVVNLSGLKASDAQANPLKLVQQGDLLVSQVN